MTAPSTDRSDLLELTGRVAVVTGATRGIGLATARLLARNGCSVVVVGREDPARAKDIAASLKADFAVNALGLTAESANPSEIRDVYRVVRAEFGRLDVLVNNAGVLHGALVGMISEGMIDETFAVNAMGPIHHMQASVRMMRRSGGSVINMTSIIGRRGDVGQVAYAASKAAVIGMTTSAAKELAPRGIRVNAIAPGFIETDMIESLPEDKYAQRIASIRMGRAGTPEDVARVALFLAGSMSEYVTGQVIGVDGGMMI